MPYTSLNFHLFHKISHNVIAFWCVDNLSPFKSYMVAYVFDRNVKVEDTNLICVLFVISWREYVNILSYFPLFELAHGFKDHNLYLETTSLVVDLSYFLIPLPFNISVGLCHSISGNHLRVSLNTHFISLV